MKLSELMRNVVAAPLPSPGLSQKEITGIATDTRKVRPGDVFVALDGVHKRGAQFALDALAAGALCSIVPADVASALPSSENIISVKDTSVALAAVASNFYENPTSGMLAVGVTGTNGKTTFTYLLESALSGKMKTGVVGTINYRYDGKTFSAPHTTPFAHDLMRIISEMRSRKVAAVVMEVSSHALAQRRVDGCEFDCCVFTNLTQDHLDYHGTMENYFEAKKRLFTELLAASPKKDKTCVVNIDDEWGAKLAASAPAGAALATYALDAPASARLTSVKMTPRGARFSCDIFAKKYEFEINLIGRYNISNALAAAVSAVSCGLPSRAIEKGFAAVRRIPGRLETIHSKNGFSIVVDYAHTPDALAKVTATLRELNPARLITLFGCGGDRDRTKRPLMGAVAASSSDMVIVTSDNPRTEDPHKILLDIEIGIKKSGASNYKVIADRKEAIEFAVSVARPGDLILLAGKGHETYQIIGEERFPFSDYETAAGLLSPRRD